MTTDTPVPSCRTCPSMLSAVDAATYFGKSVGSPMCAKYGTVLDSPRVTRDKDKKKLTERIARDCKSYGQPKPSTPATFVPRVAEPKLEEAVDMRDNASDETRNTTVRSCTQCSFYKPPQQVLNDYGWTSGMCQAKGMLVLSHMTSDVAQSCTIPLFGTMMDMKNRLIDFYTPDYYHVDIFKSYGSGTQHPLQHISDAPVSDEDRADGIIAWRKISDPQDDNRFVMLPVYDPEQFTPEERSKIPQPGDDEHPELYLDHNNSIYKIAVCWRELDETPMAWGPAGVGKTEVARHMAYLMQLPFERFSITASTELDDLAGKMMYGVKPGETNTDTEGNLVTSTYFQYGRLPKAWKNRCVILIDEPNTGQPDVWQFLRPLTDNSKQLVLDSSSGEHVERNAHTYMLMAANPSWDARNVGAATIGDADASRLMHIKFNLPPKKLEKRIISARVALDGWVISEDQLDLMMTVADDIRTMSEEGTLPITWGIRTQIKVARALKWFTPLQAYKLATDDQDPQIQEMVLQSVKSNFAGEDEPIEEYPF